MKKLVLYLASTLVAVSFYATLAGATAIAISGSEHPEAYNAFNNGSFNHPVTVTTIPLNEFNLPAWDSAHPWMSFNTADQSGGNLPGAYYYWTQFSMSGLILSTADIKGSWASDNNGVMYLNSQIMPAFTLTTSEASAGAIGSENSSNATSFELDSGFVEGMNTLMFVVTNGGEIANPTGLMVHIDSANANPVPEPGTMVLFGAGLLGLAVYSKRRNNA